MAADGSRWQCRMTVSPRDHRARPPLPRLAVHRHDAGGLALQEARRVLAELRDEPQRRRVLVVEREPLRPARSELGEVVGALAAGCAMLSCHNQPDRDAELALITCRGCRPRTSPGAAGSGRPARRTSCCGRGPPRPGETNRFIFSGLHGGCMVMLKTSSSLSPRTGSPSR